MDSSPVAIYKIHEHLRPKVSGRKNNILAPKDNWSTNFLHKFPPSLMSKTTCELSCKRIQWVSPAFIFKFTCTTMYAAPPLSLQHDSIFTPCSYLSCIAMIAFLINLGAVSVEMDFIMRLGLIGIALLIVSHILSHSSFVTNQNCAACINLVRIFSHGGGSEEGATAEACKSPSRKPSLHTAPRARRMHICRLKHVFSDFSGHENSSSRGNNGGYDLSSKILHLARR
ncbi:hypothetical protein DVH24_008715 [Malus domestica]|uniref:Uncharacterized protein n=1 Tax=Malus domestica TaxID=3750 RepID=A0A498JSJ5_MALDO|nr:hypothetical protein DVH24_008715 [Malus domestica]